MKTLLKTIEKRAGDVSYVARGGAWIFFGKGASLIASVAIMLVFANFLPKETYGSYKYILSFFAIASLTTMPGINTILTRAIARGHESTFFDAEKEKLRWSFIGVIFLLIVGGYYFFKGNFLLGGGFAVSALFLPVRRLVELTPYIWQGRKNFKTQNILEVIGFIVPAIILVGVLLISKNLILILFTYFGSYTLIRGLTYLYTRKTIKHSEKDRESILFGKHLTFIQTLSQIANQLDKVLLWHFAGPVSVAVFSFAQMPIQQLKELLPVQQLALPKLSTKTLPEMRRTLLPKFWLLILGSIPIIFLLIFVAPYVYDIFFSTYTESVAYFQILLLGVVFVPFSLLNTAFLTELRTKELYVIRTVNPVLKITLYAALTPILGIWGIVYATLAGQAIDAIMVYYYFMKITRHG